MTTELDTRDEVYLFNTQKPIANLDKDTQQKGFREIILGAKKENKHQDLWLKLRDEEFTWRNLYLGRSKTFEKDSIPEHYNMIVPIIPRCYATPDRNPAEAVVPPKGWLYIIRRYESHRGKVVELWRELKSDGLGNFSDVNIKKHKGMNQRKATGQWGFRVIVPYRIDKIEHEIWIAYSEVQWSWARILKMKEKDDDLRNTRMHKLDLSDCLNNFENSHYEAGADQKDSQEGENANKPARLYNLHTAPDAESKGFHDIMKDDIPVVYLDNPVGIARRLGLVYQDCCQVMTDYVTMLSSAPGLLRMECVGGVNKSDGKEDSKEDLKERRQILKILDATAYDPVRWFDSAKILNQFLYTKLPTKAPEDLTAKEQEDFLEKVEKVKEKRSKYLKKINEEDLKKALRPQARQDIREQILVARFHLVKFLESELADGGEDSALLNALDDYFTLSAKVEDERALRLKKIEGFDVYADAWKVFSEIIHHLDKHEYTFDSELEPQAPDGWTLRKNNDGVNLLIKIADPHKNLPIHSRLFPKMARADKPLLIDDTRIEDGDPVFKMDYFDELKLEDAEIDRFFQSVEDFLAKFNEVIAMDDRDDNDYKESIGRVRESLCRFHNGVLKSEFVEVKVPPGDILDFKNIAIEDPGVESSFQMYRRPLLALGHAGTAHFERANENLVDQQNSQTNINETITSRQKVTSVGTSRNSGHKLENVTIEKLNKVKGKGNPDVSKVTSDVGNEVSIVFDKDGPKLNKNARKIYNYRVKAVMVLDDEALKRLDGLIGKNEIRTKAFAKMISVVETINALNAVNAVMNNKNDDKSAELAAELISSFCDAIAAVGEAAEAVGKMTAKTEGMAVAGSGLGPKTDKFARGVSKASGEISTLKILGTISGLIDIHLSWKSMIENYRQNDDAYIGSAIMLSGFILNTFAAGEIAAFLGLSSTNPVTAVLAIVIFIGVLTYALLNDTHFEKWLANGPFALGNGKRDYWNNDSYKTYKRCFVNERFVADGLTLHRYLADDSHSTFALATDNDGILTDAYPIGKKLKIENNRVYLKAGEHPLAEEDTLIGVIGRPYTPVPMMQPQIEDRFLGHTPGADPMNHVPASKPGLFKSAPNPDRYPEYRYAIWCEYPHEAYVALMDALYRPQVTLTTPTIYELYTVTIRIHLPYYLKGESVLYLEVTDKDMDTGKEIIDTYAPGQKKIEEFLEDTSGDYVIRHVLKSGETHKFIVKARLDLSGDGKIQLPHEPMFCDSDIETESDEKNIKDMKLPTDNKWIVVEGWAFVNPPI